MNVELALWGLNLFFMLLGASHRLDEDKNTIGAPVTRFMFTTWIGGFLFIFTVSVLIAHLVAQAFTQPTLTVSQHISGGNVTITAVNKYPEGGGEWTPSLLTFLWYLVSVGIAPAVFYHSGYIITDRIMERIEGYSASNVVITIPKPTIPRIQIVGFTVKREESYSVAKALKVSLESREEE